MASERFTYAEPAMPRRNVGPFLSISIRLLIALGALLLTTVVVWLDRDGYRDLDGTLDDFWSCLYYATVSLSTTGYGDITPVSTEARLVNILVITPLRFLFLIVLVGTTVEVLTSRGREEYRQHRWRTRVRDHTVVIGFGVKGRTAVTTMLDSGTDPKKVVVVAADISHCEEASALGVVVVRGDGRREDVLRAAAVDSASAVIVAADSDDVTVLITLTARRLNPRAVITVAARESANASLLRQSGADSVIMTAESAGRLLAVTLLTPTAGGILEDLIDPGKGMEVVERTVTAEEIGIAPIKLVERGTLVLAIIRDGTTHRFDSGEITVFQRGDRVVLIRPHGEE